MACMLACYMYILEDESEILLSKQNDFAVNDVSSLIIYHVDKQFAVNSSTNLLHGSSAARS